MTNGKGSIPNYGQLEHLDRLLDSLVVYYSAGFECERSRIQSPGKDRVIPKTLLK